MITEEWKLIEKLVGERIPGTEYWIEWTQPQMHYYLAKRYYGAYSREQIDRTLVVRLQYKELLDHELRPTPIAYQWYWCVFRYVNKEAMSKI
jgi:hypothetical protein